MDCREKERKTGRQPVFFFSPYGAPEPRKALGERPEGVAHREVRDWPTRQEVSLGQRRDPKPRRRGSGRHPGRAFFWFLFFARAKKRNLRWVSHPQVAVHHRRRRFDRRWAHGRPP